MQKRILSAHCLPLDRRQHVCRFRRRRSALPRGSPPARSRPPPSRASAISSATRAAAQKTRRAQAPRAGRRGHRRSPKRRAAKKEAKKEAEKSGPKQPVYVVVSLSDQHVSIYDADGLVTRTRVSTGQAGHRTPTGRVQRHRQGALAPLQHLLRRADAVHAAHHLVGRRHARRRRARAIRPRTVASAFPPALRRSSSA